MLLGKTAIDKYNEYQYQRELEAEKQKALEIIEEPIEEIITFTNIIELPSELLIKVNFPAKIISKNIKLKSKK